MCGLAGLARFQGGALPAGDQLLQRMARTLEHRGPDGTSYLHDGPVGLAFTRLSIVDPVGGDQPLLSEDRTVAVIANGEVYNHRELEAGLPAGTRLRTQSDCEVLVHLYRRDGLRFLDSIRGIYAVVVWDQRRGRLLLARDRFGIKPLYFHRNRERVVFGSEIKTLFNDPGCPRGIDWESSLSDQMMTAEPLLDDTPPVTWFEEIESVPAGSILEFDLRTGEMTEHRYWRFPEPGGDLPCSPEDLTRSYGELLRASVEESGMSDAEIGLLLSGGVDSAAVAAMSGGLGELHTFTALNAGTFANGDGEYAHRIAAAVGRSNHQIVFGPDRMATPEEWKRLVWLLETPLCGPEQFYKYELHRFARATRPNLKVMLLGQASDEFNGGYTTQLAMGGDWRHVTANLRQMARRRALLTQPRLAAWWEQEPSLLTDEAFALGGEPVAGDPYAAYVAYKYRDIQQYNCWHEDRTAAGNGIEARVPFLDHRIVELTASIPHAHRERLLWDKRLLRDVLAGLLPPEIVDRRKVPFYFGAGVRHVYRTFGRMLSQDNYALLDEALSAPTASRLVDRDAAHATLRGLEDGRGVGHVEFLLRLVNLGLLERMVADVPGPVASWPAPPLSAEFVVDDWDAERDRIALLVMPGPPLEDQGVPSFAAGVLLVRSEPDDGTYYLVVDGSLEYVIDAAEDRDWLRFLRTMDGRRTLGEILAAVDADREVVLPLLAEALEVGVLELSPAEVEYPSPVPVVVPADG